MVAVGVLSVVGIHDTCARNVARLKEVWANSTTAGSYTEYGCSRGDLPWAHRGKPAELRYDGLREPQAGSFGHVGRSSLYIGHHHGDRRMAVLLKTSAAQYGRVPPRNQSAAVARGLPVAAPTWRMRLTHQEKRRHRRSHPPTQGELVRARGNRRRHALGRTCKRLSCRILEDEGSTVLVVQKGLLGSLTNRGSGGRSQL